MLICGASFAGLAVARELAGSGADVLVVDRYEIGERATSACAAPTPWLHAMGVERAIRQEIPCMAFHTPHGSARFRLPWSWSSFDYRELCRALYEQTDARFEIAKVNGRTRRHGPHGSWRHREPAGRGRARLATGPRRGLSAAGCPDLTRVGGAPGRRRHRPRRVDRPQPRPLRLRVVGAGRARAARRRRLLRAARSRQGADEGDRPAPERRARPLPGQLVPAPVAPRGRGRRVLRRRQRRPLPAALGRGDPDRVLLRDRRRARDPRGPRRRRQGRGARALRRVLAQARAGVRLRARPPAPDPATARRAR